jgi:hypothetical protein
MSAYTDITAKACELNLGHPHVQSPLPVQTLPPPPTPTGNGSSAATSPGRARPARTWCPLRCMTRGAAALHTAPGDAHPQLRAWRP